MLQVKSSFSIIAVVFTAVIFLFSGSAMAVSDADIERLEKIIEQQAKELDALKQQVQEMKKEVSTKKATVGAPAAKAKPETKKPDIKIYGQVNKAVLYSDDGDTGRGYIVDNDNSSTRFGLKASAKKDRLSVGTRIEAEWQSNPSNLVNELNKSFTQDINRRWLDLWLSYDNMGKFYLGWGSTASDGTSEVDLSGTTVIAYSSIADMAGGQIFFDKATGTRSASDTIGGAASNYDGLGRTERISYVSPSFSGFTVGTSYVNHGGGDLAVKYDAKIGGLKLAAGAAYARYGSSSSTNDSQINGSFSILHDSGFNGTIATGQREFNDSTRDDGKFYYGKFGYIAKNWCSYGDTALSVDFGNYKDQKQNNDDLDTFGLQFVQNLTKLDTEFYAGYRFHKLDRTGKDFDDINSFMSGFRVKF